MRSSPSANWRASGSRRAASVTGPPRDACTASTTRSTRSRPRRCSRATGATWPAALACGPDAVISYRSAAALHDSAAPSARTIDVTIPQRSPRKHAGIDIHRSITLRPEDTTRIRNIPVTTIARTLARPRPGRQPPRGRAGLRPGRDPRGVRPRRAARPDRPQPPAPRGQAPARACSTSTTSARPRPWSELEERFLALCRDADLPLPEVNVWIDPDDEEPRSVRADFVWREQRLIVQTDGRRTHRTAQAFEHDRREDQRLIAAGWTVIRTTWRQVTSRPERGGGDVLISAADDPRASRAGTRAGPG